MQSAPALADQIDALLPQTQCQRCGYPDCRSYAEAISRHETDIDRCPPGGEATLAALAGLLHQPPKPLATDVGTFASGTVAVIEEPFCIGCTKCIQACPVDAITGAAKQMHTVIEALCTGCGLCLPPCPVDCIQLEPAQGVTEGLEGWQFPMSGKERADALRERYIIYKRRQTERKAAKDAPAEAPLDLKAHHQAEIAAAVARVRARRGQKP
ncbi:MAG TPA: RnfABCDGE type electron transport complex subunit B [Gammaproteobacteria bacterium]|nr:RnfABCDGE type electron transport complex subunit B [Gammaproteobacteria bacterium]